MSSISAISFKGICVSNSSASLIQGESRLELIFLAELFAGVVIFIAFIKLQIKNLFVFIILYRYFREGSWQIIIKVTLWCHQLVVLEKNVLSWSSKGACFLLKSRNNIIIIRVVSWLLFNFSQAYLVVVIFVVVIG